MDSFKVMCDSYEKGRICQQGLKIEWDSHRKYMQKEAVLGPGVVI